MLNSRHDHEYEPALPGIGRRYCIRELNYFVLALDRSLILLEQRLIVSYPAALALAVGAYFCYFQENISPLEPAATTPVQP
jgi:hypothetical protein